MATSILAETRRRFGFCLAGGLAAAVGWLMFPGIPVIWEPSASPEIQRAGLNLFEHEWQPHDPVASGDGLGPVFNGRSCVECHFQGGVGGGGGNKQNVRSFEALPTKDNPEVRGGLIHAFAVQNHFLEDTNKLRTLFPVIPGVLRSVSGCQILTRDFDPIRTESVNSTALYGAGWIDRISAKSITHQSLSKSLEVMGRELSGDFHGVPAGRYRVLPDGRVGKFGWKGQFASLEEFVAAACANEIGLGNPSMTQAKPIGYSSYPDVAPDLDHDQFNALVAFVDTLPRPEEIVPASSGATEQVVTGKQLFRNVGCAVCHTPDMGGVEGIYSDFLLHKLKDREQARSAYGGDTLPDAPLPLEHPRPEEWKTPALWGVADSAPYMHDGSASTLETAIAKHQGDAETVTARFQALPEEERAAVYAFLKSLKAPSNASPVNPAILARSVESAAKSRSDRASR